jgi:SAM-dependent methyltransferase
VNETDTGICPCGGRRTRTILKADRYCTYGQDVAHADYELRSCIACGLVRTWPPPEDHDHGPFRDESFLSPYLERPALFDAYLRDTVNHIARLAPPPGTLVDVGANIGTIVALARDRGYDAIGIELNEAGVDLGRAGGLDMRATLLEEAGFEPGSLAVICLSATAEHIPDLDETFALCRTLLRPGGLLYVSNSPSIRSLGWLLERDLWYGIQPTGHVWQFTPATLRAAMERGGFRVIGERSYNLHRDFGRNRKQRLKARALMLAAALGWGDAVSMAGQSR